MCLGSHVIKTYSRQQKTIALSSAEAELHAMVANSAEVLGIIGLCRDLGMKLTGEIYADSSAALGISNRAGVGKVRHLRVQALWVQEVRSTGRLSYKKVLGTKPLGRVDQTRAGGFAECASRESWHGSPRRTSGGRAHARLRDRGDPLRLDGDEGRR